jgi:hypothetical protein
MVKPCHTPSSLHTLRNHLLRQRREILPALLINRHPQVRLRENRQRIARHILATARSFPATHKVRHSLQRAPSNQLQRHTSLERQAVAWDVHLRGAAGAIADPEACFGVWMGVELGERSRCRAREFRRVRDFVDEHLACQAGQGAEIGVCGTPVVVDFLGDVDCWWRSGSWRWEVVQQSRFCAYTSPHDLLKSTGFVTGEFGDAVAIAAASYEACYVDDQFAQRFEFRFEAWQDFFAGPDVGRHHLDDFGVERARFGFERGVVDGVRVVGAFEGVVAAVCESLFAAGPADVILCFGLFDFGYVRGQRCFIMLTDNGRAAIYSIRTHLVLPRANWPDTSSD